MVSVYAEKAGNVWFGVAFSGERVYATAFGSSEKWVLQSLRESVPSNVPLQRVEKTKFAELVIAVLKDVYDGKYVSKNLRFVTEYLSKYAKRVIETVCMIPSGYVASYGGVAHAAGGSPRAVGGIMASNPFAPLCPCHRVVGSDFQLCGYGGGLDVKLAFLKRERRGYSSKKVINAGGGKLELFPVEFVLDRVEKGKR
ncbi:MAG: methylated-DNA--[protein]-cysteine S-methyltransferase [Candidatus Bathyarchaeia archaeon]|jgi:O-6-methylguanine DNA methyltransferase